LILTEWRADAASYPLTLWEGPSSESTSTRETATPAESLPAAPSSCFKTAQLIDPLVQAMLGHSTTPTPSLLPVEPAKQHLHPAQVTLQRAPAAAPAPPEPVERHRAASELAEQILAMPTNTASLGFPLIEWFGEQAAEPPPFKPSAWPPTAEIGHCPPAASSCPRSVPQITRELRSPYGGGDIRPSCSLTSTQPSPSQAPVVRAEAVAGADEDRQRHQFHRSRSQPQSSRNTTAAAACPAGNKSQAFSRLEHCRAS